MQLTGAIADYTLQEYLDINGTILFPKAQAIVARARLTFLSFDDFSNKPPECWLRQPHLHGSETPSGPYHFTSYAAVFWNRHASLAGETILMDAILDFLLRPANVAYNWLLTMINEERIPNWPPIIYDYPFENADFLRMLLVVQLHLHAVLVKLLETRKRPAEDALDPVICRLACHAAKRRYKEIVRTLLAQEDVDWNMRGPCDETLLMLVAEWRDEGILRTVLRQGCPVNAISYQESALHRAVRRGCTSSTRILLEAGAEVDGYGNRGQSIISQAIIGGVSGESLGKMIDLLLEYKADINAHGSYSHTPLHYAADTPILDLDTYAVEYLILKSANPNLPK